MQAFAPIKIRQGAEKAQASIAPKGRKKDAFIPLAEFAAQIGVSVDRIREFQAKALNTSPRFLFWPDTPEAAVSMRRFDQAIEAMREKFQVEL